jgi:hypothetical protein
MLRRDTFLGQIPVEKGTLAQGDINITIHGPKKPPEEKMEKGSGDFTDCMSRIVPAMAKEGKSPDDPNAFCAWYEHNQSGHWPGEKSVGKRDAFLGGFGYEPSFDEILKAWSDAARAAALEARRQGHSGAPAEQSTQAGAETHQAATSMGWEARGTTGDGAQTYDHPSMPGHAMTVHANGAWEHAAPGGYKVQGQNSGAMSNYLNHLHGRTAQAA